MTQQIEQELAEVFADFHGDRSELIPLLQQVQAKIGYLPDDAMVAVAEFARVPEATVYGVATFYAQFRFTRPGRHTIKVCLGTACHVRGGQRILERLQDDLSVQAGNITEDYRFGLERVACFGCCALAPVVVIDNTVYSKVTPAKTRDITQQYE